MSHRRCWCRGASCCSPAADCSRSDCCSSANGGHRLTGFAICCGKPRCFVVGGGSWLFITLGRVAGGRESQIRVFWKCPQWFKTWLRKKCTRTVLQQLLDNYFQSRLSTRLLILAGTLTRLSVYIFQPSCTVGNFQWLIFLALGSPSWFEIWKTVKKYWKSQQNKSWKTEI